MFGSLKKVGVLGINNRIGRFILRYNQRKYYPIVDDKAKTDQMLKETDIKMPENYLVIENIGELKNFSQALRDIKQFVIKPAMGSQGNGIVVIVDTIKENNQTYYIRSSGKKMTQNEVDYHISSILSGLYSLSGMPDKAIIQEKISSSEVFTPYSYGGIPDVRVIVFMGYPVMAMVRLPTKSSQGRANLHQGAVGCGLNIKTGQVVHAICLDRPIAKHPETGSEFIKLKISMWQEILNLASKVYEVSKLGYMGVDIVLDPKSGPILLEMNARPGLSIQLANQAGLVHRLDYISNVAPVNLGPEDRVNFLLNHFPFTDN